GDVVDRVRGVGALVTPVLGARGERQRAGPQVDQVAGDVGGELVQGLLAAVAHHRLDEGQHLRGDRAGAAEHVERHATRSGGAGGAAGVGVAERQGDVADVVGAVVGLLGFVLAGGDV